MKCPVCCAIYRPAVPPSYLCRRCGVDLSPLIDLHDRAIWHHRQAIASFKAGDRAAATRQNDLALALYPNHHNFQAFAGQLRALEGEFATAIAAWKQAQQLAPQHPIASNCLEICRQLLLCE